VVRTTGDPMSVAGAVRSAVRALDGNLPVSNVRPMAEVVSTALATPRLTGFLLGTFAAIALTLAAVGIYGVLSYLVARRTHEIGIRLAVGANRAQVLRLVLRQALTLAGLGITAGIVAALMLTQLMQSLLYEVRPADPMTFIAVTVALIVVALLAGALPAYRATRVSPVIALRTE
jgi:putative ABC transport system permease protein